MHLMIHPPRDRIITPDLMSFCPSLWLYEYTDGHRDYLIKFFLGFPSTKSKISEVCLRYLFSVF